MKIVYLTHLSTATTARIVASNVAQLEKFCSPNFESHSAFHPIDARLITKRARQSAIQSVIPEQLHYTPHAAPPGARRIAWQSWLHAGPVVHDETSGAASALLTCSPACEASTRHRATGTQEGN